MGEPRQQTVLVVDDSRATADALAELLSSAGFAVQTARDGHEALQRCAADAIDLVLLDVELPELDGLQALRLIRGTPSPRYLPVVMMSVRQERQAVLAALKLGADDFVHKPWDGEELLARVARLLRLRGRVDELLGEAEQLHHLSVTDGLTGLHNHRSFQGRLKEEFRRAQRYDDPLALIMLDVDHFKAVNDQHGHQVGDQVLRELAGCLRGSVRDTDLLARYGGEEFAVLLPRTHLAGALTVAERIWRGAGELRAPRGIRITVSLGVSSYPGRAVLTPDQLLRTADEALYRAKREGRNRISLYQQSTFFSDPSAPAG